VTLLELDAIHVVVVTKSRYPQIREEELVTHLELYIRSPSGSK
jgi:hypothetical protein